MQRGWRYVLRGLLAAVLAGVGACRPDGSSSWDAARSEPDAARGDVLPAWVAGEMVTLTDRTPAKDDPQVYDADRRTIHLAGGANETLGLQIVVDPGGGGVRGLSLSASDLAGKAGKIPAGNVQVFHALGVRVFKYPAWYLRLVDDVPREATFYDALRPLAAGDTISAKASQRVVLWVDVQIGRDVRAGTYTGTLRLKAKGRADRVFTLELQVYPFVLPDARAVAAVGGFSHKTLFAAFVREGGKPYLPIRMDPRRPMVHKGLVAMRHLVRLAHQHRVDLFDRDMRPLLKRTAEGKVRLLWDDYDAIVRPYLDGTAFDDRLRCVAWPVPVSNDWPDPARYGGPTSERYKATLLGVARGACKHLREDLGADRQALLWPWRGEVSQRGYDRLDQLARWLHPLAGGIPILSQLPAQPVALTTWKPPDGFAGRIGIFAAAPQWTDPKQAASLRRSDRPLAGAWLVPGRPPYLPSLGVIATAADVRAIPWFAARYHFTGLFLPEVLHWDGDELAVTAGAETRLFYPGTSVGLSEALPSVRLKRLRRGLQDLAYLTLLQKRRPGAARAVVNAMVRYGALDAVGDHYLDPRLDGWVKDPVAWQLAGRILADEIRATLRDDRPTQREVYARRLAWRQLDERTRGVVVEQIRSRVLPTGDANTLEARVWLDVYNQFGKTIDLRATLDKLPTGWKPAKGPAQPGNLGPCSRRVIELVAEGRTVPQGSTGKIPLDVRIESSVQPARTVSAPVAFLNSAWFARPPKIDGVLDDWPAQARNTAGRFRLIGRRGRKPDGYARRQTSVFVNRDATHLYVAFRCEEPNLRGMVTRPNNVLHYEQLMACGEDLVEVLLDPGAAAKGPEDLYHLAVKPNGIFVAERGVGTSPPLGKSVPWPVAARVATGRGKGVWTVEMAIPLSDLGPKAGTRFWGANFTRFATQGAESSSWSEAPRYFYDPRNLGTLYLPPPTP